MLQHSNTIVIKQSALNVSIVLATQLKSNRDGNQLLVLFFHEITNSLYTFNLFLRDQIEY